LESDHLKYLHQHFNLNLSWSLFCTFFKIFTYLQIFDLIIKEKMN